MATKSDTFPFSRFERMLAFRYLRARRKEGFISVIAVFSFLGIMLGVATLIIVMGVMNGFHNELLDKVLGLNGHVIVHKTGGPFTDYEEVAKKLRKVRDVEAVIPLIEGQAMVSTRANATGAQIRGVSEAQLANLTKVSKNIKFGDIKGFDNKPSIIIGTRMANDLNVRVGDKVTLITPRGASTPFGFAPRRQSFPVSAIFEIGMSEYDRLIVFMPLNTAQKFFSKPKRVDVLEVMVKDPEDVDSNLLDLARVGGDEIFLVDWRQRNNAFFGALQVERNVMFLILVIILIVAAFNIISGIIMLVKDKGRDIAVLRTMGATRGAIMRVFLITGASIGIVGTIAGLIIGVAVCLNIDAIQTFISNFTGSCVVDPTIYYLCKMPAEMDSVETSVIVVLSLFLSILATLYPSWRAAQMDPVEALRYE